MAHARQTGFLKSSLGVAFATLLSRALGLVRVMFEARVLGGGSVASAWFLAFSIPNLFRRLLGEGALGTALIPLVAQAEAEHGPDKVRRDLGVVFAVLSLILALVVALIAGGALGLRAFARSETGAAMFPLLATERMQLVLAILPLLMPYAFFICLVGVVGAVLNTRKEFVLPALGALLLNFFLIGGLGWGYYRAIPPAGLPQFLNVLSFLVLGSGALQLVLMLLLLWYHGRFPSLKRESFRDCAILKQLWKLVLPGMIGGAALQISFLVDRMLAIWLGPQAVPALNNVDRIVDLPIGIFALALGSVLMANMAQAAARGSREELAEDLVFSLRHVYFVCIPMAVLVMLFWQPLIRMLCLGGNYTESDLEATRYVAIFYGAGIPSFCVLKVVLPVYYALMNGDRKRVQHHPEPLSDVDAETGRHSALHGARVDAEQHDSDHAAAPGGLQSAGAADAADRAAFAAAGRSGRRRVVFPVSAVAPDAGVAVVRGVSGLRGARRAVPRPLLRRKPALPCAGAPGTLQRHAARQAFRIDRVSAPRPGGNGGDNAAPAVIPRFRPEKNVLKFFLPPSPDTAP